MDAPTTVDLALISRIEAEVKRKGYWVGRAAWKAYEVDNQILETARALGELYIPDGCAADAPIIRTAPSRRKNAAPFDRPEPIGWHGDFASHDNRPDLSFVYVIRSDPAGASAGAWRLAAVDDVLTAISRCDGGPDLLRRLTAETVPFSYRDGQPPRWFPLVCALGDQPVGLRFFEPSIRRGYLAVGQDVPEWIEDALSRIREASDAVAIHYPTTSGSLLVANNWRSLHDRTVQSVARRGLGREALLLFASAA